MKHIAHGWVPRFLISVLSSLVIGLILAVLSGCSVYESPGRRDFESKAPAQIQNRNIGQSVEQTCWTQSPREALWETPDMDARLVVRSLDIETLEVCLE